MNSNPDSLGPRHSMTFREWLALLPWDFIYALGVIVLVALVTLVAFVISQIF